MISYNSAVSFMSIRLSLAPFKLKEIEFLLFSSPWLLPSSSESAVRICTETAASCDSHTNHTPNNESYPDDSVLSCSHFPTFSSMKLAASCFPWPLCLPPSRHRPLWTETWRLESYRSGLSPLRRRLSIALRKEGLRRNRVISTQGRQEPKKCSIPANLWEGFPHTIPHNVQNYFQF